MVDVNHLPDFLREYDRNATTFTVRPGTPLAEVEKLLIRQTLTHVTSNREEAAQALGISRRALQYKLKQYGLLEGESAPSERHGRVEKVGEHWSQQAIASQNGRHRGYIVSAH